jgi:hypothetical protein
VVTSRGYSKGKNYTMPLPFILPGVQYHRHSKLYQHTKIWHQLTQCMHAAPIQDQMDLQRTGTYAEIDKLAGAGDLS